MPGDRTILPILDDATRPAAIVRHLRFEGVDFEKSHGMYHDDAILEFPQSGERFIGRESFREWRQRYPARVGKRIRRMTGGADLWVTEVMLSYDGGPWMLGLSVDQFRGDKIARQIIYVMDAWEAPDWRAPWATRFDPHASIDPWEWEPGSSFGLEAELDESRDDR